MAGLETHYSSGANALVLELGKDVDSFRNGTLSLADFIRNATEVACALKTGLRMVPDFIHACEAARSFTPCREKPVHSQTLSETRHYRITLLGIHRESPVPVHDHPGMISLVLLLEGQLHAPQYEISEQRRGSMFVQLVTRSKKILQPEDIAIAMNETGSLHGLQPLDRNAVCLTIQLRIEQERTPRSWYFPLTSRQRNRSALWYRIEDKEISNGI